jgi:PAS domain S-box-containing protein
MEAKEPPSGPADHLFFDAFRASPIGIAIENLEGQPLFANPALCSMLGFSEEEMRGKHWVEFSPPEDAEKDWALFTKLKGGSIDHYQMDKRFFRRDGSLIWGRLSISLLKNGGTPLAVAAVEDITERKLAQEALSTLSQRLIEVQEEERSRIARELHDDINQRLALLTVTLDGLSKDLSPSPSGPKEVIDGAVKELVDVSTDIQAMSHRLHSSRLEHLGLAKAMARFCRELSNRHRVQIELQTENVPNDLSKEISLCLFRVLQEALQNAIKYSGRTHFQIVLSGQPTEIELTVQDWGKGFHLDGAMRTGGIGLISMNERLKLVNGELSIDSQLGRGTIIHARAPLPARAKPAGADA